MFGEDKATHPDSQQTPPTGANQTQIHHYRMWAFTLKLPLSLSLSPSPFCLLSLPLFHWAISNSLSPPFLSLSFCFTPSFLVTKCVYNMCTVYVNGPMS